MLTGDIKHYMSVCIPEDVIEQWDISEDPKVFFKSFEYIMKSTISTHETYTGMTINAVVVWIPMTKDSIVVKFVDEYDKVINEIATRISEFIGLEILFIRLVVDITAHDADERIDVVLDKMSSGGMVYICGDIKNDDANIHEMTRVYNMYYKKYVNTVDFYFLDREGFIVSYFVHTPLAIKKLIF